MKNLDDYKFSTKKGFNSTLIKLRYDHLSKFFKGKSCLELGCADGEGTKILLNYFDRIVGVDGSEKLIKKARKEIKNKKVDFIVSYFEDLNLSEKFDTIFLGHILEHVEDPIKVIISAKKFLHKKSVMLIDVPNALSIHRQVGVLMGMIPSEYSLNEADISIGHRRVYDLKKLEKDVKKTGLKVIGKGGLFLKAFSNAQLDKILDRKGIIAFNEVGNRYPDIAAEIYIVCSQQ